MKTLKSLMAIALISLIPFTFTACEDKASESCEQQDMNEVLNCGVEKNVEVCCTEGSNCVYKYAGVEYADNNEGLTNLADALGCTYKSSANYEEQHQLIIKLLKDLKNKAIVGI
jgi:hypothetical protein